MEQKTIKFMLETPIKTVLQAVKDIKSTPPLNKRSSKTVIDETENQYKITIPNIPFTSIPNEIIFSDKYDISTSASLSPKRALVSGYTNSYFKLATVPLTLKKNLDTFQSWDDLNQSNVTVAVTLGTTQEMQAKSYFPNAQIKSIEAPARDFQEVLAGRADAHITSNVEAATLVETYPELAIVPVKEPKSPTPLAWLIDQDDQVWINYINHWIELKTAQGFFDNLMSKWNLKSL